MKAIITVGCSGSGKSTWAKNLQKQDKKSKWKIIERDEIRMLMVEQILGHNDFDLWQHWEFTAAAENNVTSHQNGLINVYAAAGRNIIISDTNLNAIYRNEMAETLMRNGYDVEFEYFNVPFRKLLQNDNKRRNSVGYEVISKQYFKFMEDHGQRFGFHKMVKVNELSKPAIIFDIDGTLALHTSTRTPYELHRVNEDSPCPVLGELANMYFEAGYEIIIMSGREDICKELTIEWLDTHGIPFDHFHMRKAKDNRPDFDVKNEIFQEHINGKFNVKVWFDDRPAVVRLGHILGVKMLSVGNQHVEF